MVCRCGVLCCDVSGVVAFCCDVDGCVWCVLFVLFDVFDSCGCWCGLGLCVLWLLFV